MKKLLLILFLLSIFSSCSHRRTAADTIELGKSTVQYNLSPDLLANDTNRQKWVQDSCGCLRLRTLQLAESLIEEYDVLHRSKDNFISVFGEPNNVKTMQDKAILSYYIESVCYDGLFVESGDKAWIDFEFRNDTLISIPDVFYIE
jgi:hypothetical protein